MLAEQYAARRSQMDSTLAELHARLRQEEQANTAARGTLALMKERLQLKQHQRAQPVETKTFLASEKLAVSKKKSTQYEVASKKPPLRAEKSSLG